MLLRPRPSSTFISLRAQSAVSSSLAWIVFCVVVLRLPAAASTLPTTTTTMAQALPYNPTRIFQHDKLLYIFQPAPDSPTQFQIYTADISSKFSADNLPYTTLQPSLPFLDPEHPRAWTPVLDNGGNLTVYTGDCSQGATGGQVWSFTPNPSDKSGQGTWQQENVSFDPTKVGADKAAAIGPNFLNGGVAFSAIVNGDAMETGAYFFGGMCPDSQSNVTLDQNSDIGEWQAAANYSNYMVTLEPTTSKANDQNTLTYQLDVSTSRGPPIAEAGFTLTGLSPSFSNRSDGTQTQQQNFVLVGGHTNAAFINMSQVALFSLPQQGWTFVPVQQPDTSRTDLTVRTDIESIDPRSGHTAVLSPDGQRIIVFGGWVGDVNTPAEPQLAVLNVGDGYGGQGDWQWTVPNLSGSGLPDNAGIYGHGAVMLPGGVMMITGGYSITAPTNSRLRRDDTNGKTQTLFLNVTSNTWTTDYSPPTGAFAEPANNGPLSSPGQKAGLGVGLGIGFAAIAGLLLFYFWYTKRLKGQRDEREKQLHDLALGAHRYEIEAYSPGFDGRGGNANAVDYFQDNGGYFYQNDDQRGYGWRRVNGHDAERTGLLVEIPSPTRGLRRSLGGRPMTRYDERRVRGSGNIHPIDELEEDQENDGDGVNDRTPLNGNPEMSERTHDRGASIFENAPVLDPFTDSNRPSADRGSNYHSAPTSPTREMLEEEANSNQSASDTLSAHRALFPGRGTPSPTGGRVSPDKSTSSDRTGSNLSERSTRSNLSFNSNGGSVARTSSMRSTAILNNAAHANPFKTPDLSPTSDRAHRNSGGWHSPVDPRTRSLTSIRSTGRPATGASGTDNKNGDGDSFTTARSSFMHLQAEGEALLGGNPERPRPGTASTASGSNAHTYRDTEGSMSRAGTVTTATSVSNGLSRTGTTGTKDRSRGWLGSVRRALSRSSTSAERTRSLTTSAAVPEPYTDDPLTSAGPSDPESKRNSMTVGTPRRAASDASFWRSKRGRQDWLDEELDPSDPRNKWRRNSGDDWGTPEDIALAEKERQRKEWRERGNLLINLSDTDQLPTPRTPIRPEQLGVPAANGASDRPSTPADEGDWDVEAAVERRVVQVMFTVPKSKLRVVNADVDRNSILSNARSSSASHSKEKLDLSPEVNAHTTSTHEGPVMASSSSASPSRVKNLADKFEQLQQTETRSSTVTARSSPRASPSPSNSIRSVKIRAKRSNASVRNANGNLGS